MGTHGDRGSGRPMTAVFPELRTSLLGRAGMTGPAQRHALARLTEGWLAELAAQAGLNVGGVALVAVGGLGRAELSPKSDLDLVLLHSTETPASFAEMLAERLWYPIWDSGLRLDHSVRSVGGARQIARLDLPAVLGMLDLRHIAGDPDLAATLHRKVLADWRSDAKERLPALRASCRERAERSGELAFATVPDLKEAKGGLRDLIVMRAVAASWLADCPHQGLAEARAGLLDIRDAIHQVTGRATDRLQAQDQDAVAEFLGLPDRDELLRRISDLGRTVVLAADLTWRRVDRALQPSSAGTLSEVAGRFVRRAERTPLAHGVVEQDGEAVLARGADPAADPTLALRAAAAAARHGLPVNPATVSRLSRLAGAVPGSWPAGALDAFVSLLGAGEPMLPVWEAYDQAGLIDAWLPGWARLRSLPQHDPIHLYTVDRHLTQTAVNASGLVRRVSRPDLLLLAAILHDVGKGLPGDHSETGPGVARPWLERMGLSQADADVVSTLIRHHLLLADCATRRDPDDPATLATVAAAVGDVRTLDLLEALTEADARAAGPAAWNAWKAGQVARLAARVRATMAGERPAPVGELTAVERRVLAGREIEVEIGGSGAGEVQGWGFEITMAAPDRTGLLAATAGVMAGHRLTVRAATARVVDGRALQTWLVATEFGSPPAADLVRADLIAAVAGTAVPAQRSRSKSRRAVAAPSAPPQVRIVPDASERATVIEIRAQDRAGLLHQVARALTEVGVSIASARIHTLGADVVDVLYLREADGSPLSPGRGDAVAAAVLTALSGG